MPVVLRAGNKAKEFKFCITISVLTNSFLLGLLFG